jgi:transcription elongation factor SPT6
MNDTYRDGFLSAVRETLDAIFRRHLEVPFIWHYRRDTLRLLAEDGSRKIFLHRDELWTVYDLGLKYKAIYQRREQVSKLYESMKDLDPSFSDIYLENHVLSMPDGSAIQSIEAANEALAWLEMRHSVLAERAKELETTRAERKRAGGVGKKHLRKGRIADLLPVSKYL